MYYVVEMFDGIKVRKETRPTGTVVKRRYRESYHTRAALTGRGNRGVNVWARYGHGERGAEGPEAALSPRKSQCSRRAWVGHVSDGAATEDR